MVHLLLTLQLVMKNAQMSLAKGFFALFPHLKKCEVGLALGVGTAPRVEPIHAGCSAGGRGGGLARCPDPAQDAGAAGPASSAHQRLFPGKEEEEEEEEEEAVAEVLRATSSSFRSSHSEIWTLFYEPFVLAVSCSVSWCCLV